MDGAEVWRPIAGYEGRYEVSNMGPVRSLSTYRSTSGGILKPWVQNKGYHYVTLRRVDGRRETFGVHRPVLETFVGPCPEGHQAAHDNGDPSVNTVRNLRWATAKENIADRTRHGRTRRGEENGSARLDRHIVKTIKKMRDGFSAYETARLACVAPSTIERIWAGQIWRHI